jgi:uncharacterized protein (TIGR03435 family)
MNESRKTIERILQTEPTRVSDGELDGIGERMLYKLHHSNPDDIVDDMEADGVRVPHRLKSDWWKPVAAAVLIGMVASGVYALRVQRASTSKVALPAAQSSAAGENPQVAAITSESTKPGPAPSREEALAPAAAQIAAAQATDTGAARPKFAAASVRPLPVGPPDINNGLKCLGVDGTVSATARRGRCTGQTDLAGLVLAAYRTYPPIVFVTEGPRITGIPDSLRGRFQIEAVADDPEHVTDRELQLMLQTLLEDRFKARVHLETREVDGYVLTIAKSGIKFKETSVDEKASATTLTVEEQLARSRERCQYNGRLARAAEIFVRGKCGMKELSTYVGKGLLPLNIADKTGLMGIYDIDFVLEAVYLSPPAEGGGGVRGGGGQPVRRQFTTPIPKALEEQLGLHLERTKIPVEFVVVDHIEQPTEN